MYICIYICMYVCKYVCMLRSSFAPKVDLLKSLHCLLLQCGSCLGIVFCPEAFRDTCSFLQKKSFVEEKYPLLLPGDNCRLQGKTCVTLPCAKSLRSCRLLLIFHMGRGNLENKGHQALVQRRMLQNWRFRRHLSLLFCLRSFVIQFGAYWGHLWDAQGDLFPVVITLLPWTWLKRRSSLSL